MTSYSDTKVTGTIDVTEDGILMFSIPYDPSWKLKVNGVKTETCEVAEALLGVALETGSYTIELSYCPRGLLPGIAVSVVSLLILLTVYYFYRKEKKSSKEKTTLNDGIETEEEE